jgi:hypothetical protein
MIKPKHLDMEKIKRLFNEHFTFDKEELNKGITQVTITPKREKNIKMKITILSDNGHGWAKVRRSTLLKLGIDQLISHYSYQRGQYVFLEEDCDLSILINALDQHNIKYSFESRHTNKTSKVRGYESYKKNLLI